MKELSETFSNLEDHHKTTNNQDFLDLSHKLFKSLKRLKKLIASNALLNDNQSSPSNSASFITTVDGILALSNQLIEYLGPFTQRRINDDYEDSSLKGKERIDLQTENDNIDSNSISLNEMHLDNFITKVLSSSDNEDEKKLVSKLSQHLLLLYSYLLLLISLLDRIKEARLSSDTNVANDTELVKVHFILKEVMAELFEIDSHYAESQVDKIDIPNITIETKILPKRELTEQSDFKKSELYSKSHLESTRTTLNARSLELHDLMNTPVTSHLEPLNEREAAAKTIQTWWRQIYRAKHLHRTPALFSTLRNTLNNRFIANTLPPNLKHLALRTLPPLLTTTRHFSDKLDDILHDGVIYSKHKTKTTSGFGTDLDSKHFDDRLVFTTPHYTYPSHLKKGMTFDLAKLITSNGQKSLYFKFFDWVFDFFRHRVELCPEISLILSSKFPISTACFINSKTEEVIATIDIPGDMCVYHGYSGLNEYLTFFIFKLISLLPAEFNLLKDNIFSYFTHLDQSDQLITHLQSMMKSILTLAEIDFVNSLKLNFDFLINVTIGDIVYDIDELKKRIALNDLNYIQQHFSSKMFRESFFFVFGMLQVARNNAAQAVVDFIKHEYAPQLAFHGELLERANYVYEQHLCKRYQDTNIDATDVLLTTPNGVINRPNHGLAHTLRVASYVENVVEYFQHFSNNPNFKIFCNQLTSEDILDIQTALLFSVSGRECELGFSSNPDLYNHYREICAVQYENFARSKNFPEDKIAKFRELVRFLGNPGYVKDLQDESKSFIFHIMNLAHKLDLMRCYNLSSYLHAINVTNELVVEHSPLQENALNELFSVVTKRTLATGDRMFCKYYQGKLTSEMNDYDHVLFFKASTKPSTCLALLQNRRPYTSIINDNLNESTCLDNCINIPNEPILEDQYDILLYKKFEKNPNNLFIFFTNSFSKINNKKIIDSDDEIGLDKIKLF